MFATACVSGSKRLHKADYLANFSEAVLPWENCIAFTKGLLSE